MRYYWYATWTEQWTVVHSTDPDRRGLVEPPQPKHCELRRRYNTREAAEQALPRLKQIYTSCDTCWWDHPTFKLELREEDPPYEVTVSLSDVPVGSRRYVGTRRFTRAYDTHREASRAFSVAVRPGRYPNLVHVRLTSKRGNVSHAHWTAP